MNKRTKILLFLLVCGYAVLGVQFIIRAGKEPVDRYVVPDYVVQHRSGSSVVPPAPSTKTRPQQPVWHASVKSQPALSIQPVLLYHTSKHQVHQVGTTAISYRTAAVTDNRTEEHQPSYEWRTCLPLLTVNTTTRYSYKAAATGSTQRTDYTTHRHAMPQRRSSGLIDDPDPIAPADPLDIDDGLIDDPDPPAPADPLHDTPIGALPMIFLLLLAAMYCARRAHI